MDKDNTKNKKASRRSPFRKIMDRLDGNTVELKKECAHACGKTIRTIERYYSGDQEIGDLEFAWRFLDWANGKRVPKSEKFSISDLITDTRVTN